MWMYFFLIKFVCCLQFGDTTQIKPTTEISVKLREISRPTIAAEEAEKFPPSEAKEKPSPLQLAAM